MARTRRTTLRTLASLLALALSSSAVEADYNNYDSSGTTYTDDGDAFMGLQLDVCDDSVVAITYMQVKCDSPYTFYYGNGANRNSRVCDYGDKATLTVAFTVLDDLQEEDQEIFVTMAAYDDNDNILASTYPERLCRDYVGQDCTRAGKYMFETRLKLTSATGNSTKFSPVIHMAFSTKSDSGYNLGAVNMECLEWDQDAPVLVAWSDETQPSGVVEFVSDFGMLIVACISLTASATFIWIRSYDNPGFDHFPPYISEHAHSGETSFIEL